jgi:lipoyl-dependent peroxiredoxin
VAVRIRRVARASWEHDVPGGSGRMAVESGLFDSPFTLRGRVGDGPNPNPNPEELLGAAHAGCFAMSLANLLSEAGHPPRHIDARATVHLEQQESGFSITRIDLDVTGDVPGVGEDQFARHAEEAKRTCPVSRALAGTSISLTAALAA